MNGEPPYVVAVEVPRKPSNGCPENPAQAALANLMSTCGTGRTPRFLAGDTTHGTQQRRDARIEWTDANGQQRAFTLSMQHGRIEVENSPVAAPEVPDAINAVDKMLQAISEGWNIRAFHPKPGFAVISWDRMSHGNHPAVVTQCYPETVAFYYEAPDEYGTDNRQYES